MIVIIIIVIMPYRQSVFEEALVLFKCEQG